VILNVVFYIIFVILLIIYSKSELEEEDHERNPLILRFFDLILHAVIFCLLIYTGRRLLFYMNHFAILVPKRLERLMQISYACFLCKLIFIVLSLASASYFGIQNSEVTASVLNLVCFNIDEIIPYYSFYASVRSIRTRAESEACMNEYEEMLTRSMILMKV
jgi:peptidoglycan/LPS O-acetylase OafA/YrhL